MACPQNAALRAVRHARKEKVFGLVQKLGLDGCLEALFLLQVLKNMIRHILQSKTEFASSPPCSKPMSSCPEASPRAPTFSPNATQSSLGKPATLPSTLVSSLGGSLPLPAAQQLSDSLLTEPSMKPFCSPAHQLPAKLAACEAFAARLPPTQPPAPSPKLSAQPQVSQRLSLQPEPGPQLPQRQPPLQSPQPPDLCPASSDQSYSPRPAQPLRCSTRTLLPAGICSSPHRSCDSLDLAEAGSAQRLQ